MHIIFFTRTVTIKNDLIVVTGKKNCVSITGLKQLSELVDCKVHLLHGGKKRIKSVALLDTGDVCKQVLNVHVFPGNNNYFLKNKQLNNQ